MVAEDRLAEGADADFMQAQIATAASTVTTCSARPKPCATASSKAPDRYCNVPGGFLNMALPPVLQRVPLPIFGATAVIVRQPQAGGWQCTSGIVGSMPALNARPAAQLDEWLAEITETLAAWDRDHPGARRRRSRSTRSFTRPMTGSNTTCRSAPSTRCRSYHVFGGTHRHHDAVHSWAASFCTTSSTNTFAKKAIEKGADGLIAVAAGAGGHAGVKTRLRWCRRSANGSAAAGVSGAISTGSGVLAHWPPAPISPTRLGLCRNR